MKRRSHRRKKEKGHIFYTQIHKNKQCPLCQKTVDIIFFRQQARCSHNSFTVMACPVCSIIEKKKWDDFTPKNQKQEFDKITMLNVFEYMLQTTNIHIDYEEVSSSLDKWEKQKEEIRKKEEDTSKLEVNK